MVRILHNAKILVAMFWAPKYLSWHSISEVHEHLTPSSIKKLLPSDTPTLFFAWDCEEFLTQHGSFNHILQMALWSTKKEKHTVKGGLMVSIGSPPLILAQSHLFGGGISEQSVLDSFILQPQFQNLVEESHQLDLMYEKAKIPIIHASAPTKPKKRERKCLFCLQPYGNISELIQCGRIFLYVIHTEVLDHCHGWAHRECTLLNQEQWNTLVNTQMQWFCGKCAPSAGILLLIFT